MQKIQLHLKSLHPAQAKILHEATRFNVLKCGRRFGKTQLTIELAVNVALDGGLVGYWNASYKDLSEVWLELKTTLFDLIKTKDEQLKSITLITGGKIDMWSMDDPNSGRGRKYKRAIIDEAEKARHFKDAWEQTIRATLVDYSGDAWFMSTPKFGRTYFKEIFQNQNKYNDWKSWRFTSFDNPYLPKHEVEAARLQLDDLTFRCEFLAEDVDVTNNPFAYAFSESKHVGSCEYNPRYELLLSFDFNVDPITCVVAQQYDNTIHFINEFRLQNSDIYELCDRVKAMYPNALLLVTGDATGQNRSALAKGNINYYTVIEQSLNLTPNQMLQPTINPSVADSRVLCNSILQNYRIVIDKENCKHLIEDLKYVEVDDKGDIKKDRSAEFKKADELDCFRYLLNTHFSWFINLK